MRLYAKGEIMREPIRECLAHLKIRAEDVLWIQFYMDDDDTVESLPTKDGQKILVKETNTGALFICVPFDQIEIGLPN